jgi:hypothetical protein
VNAAVKARTSRRDFSRENLSGGTERAAGNIK